MVTGGLKKPMRPDDVLPGEKQRWMLNLAAAVFLAGVVVGIRMRKGNDA